MPNILDSKQRDSILSTLESHQVEFLKNRVKRGKKTAFANVLAKDKGITLPNDTDGENIEFLLSEWVLDDYIDSGYVNPNTKCECGRSLRYQYIVKHKTTGEIRRFGKDHFEEHTAIPSKIVNEILKGFMEIDYELDELLFKIHENWKLEDHLQPEGITFPIDILEHIKNDVPLLDKQIARLKTMSFSRKKDIQDTEEEPTENSSFIEDSFTSSKHTGEEQFTFELFETSFNTDKMHNISAAQSPLFSVTPELADLIYELLQQGVTSARVICEILISNRLIRSKRYSTNKPKMYPLICMHLDSLVSKNELLFVEEKSQEDRIYRLNLEEM